MLRTVRETPRREISALRSHAMRTPAVNYTHGSPAREGCVMPIDDAAIRDSRVRQDAFAFLDGLRGVHGDVLPWSELSRGLAFEGVRVPLVSQQGIFKPRVLRDAPLSIRTTPPKPGVQRPYDDEVGHDGLLRYRYQGDDPDYLHNRWLRRALERQLPLIYLHGVEPGWYVAAYPVRIVHDDPRSLAVTVAVDEVQSSELGRVVALGSVVSEPVRRYTTRVAVARLHQASFRHRVLAAYRQRCGVCRLGHVRLLDAAHIIPDSEDGGDPVVPNGLTLCKLHHAAYDAKVMGIRPDLVIEICEDVLREVDGPMLRHGLQDVNGWRLRAPRSASKKPDPQRLEVRY